MNNRFKFRIFDKETGRYYKTRISKGSGCVVYQHPGSSHYAWIQIGTMFAELERGEKTYTLTELEPDFIIEQCTGLKDNCGNLIYEGDIIGDGEDDYVIKWDGNRTRFVAEDIDTSYEIEDVLDPTICVIGNIHEQVEQKD